MIARFKFYQFNDKDKSVVNESDAINLFMEEIEFVKQDKIAVLVNDYGIAVWENELETPIRIRENNNYNLTLRTPIEEELLAGKRYLERYSYFKIHVENFNGKGVSIMISTNFETGEKFQESASKNSELYTHEAYISYLVCGLKQKCNELDIANLHFTIMDLEYNFNTSYHTCQYAAKHFVDKYVTPELVKIDSA